MFKRKKHTESHRVDWADKAAGKIAGAGIFVQTAFARAMHKIVSALPRQQLKFVVLAFFTLSGAFSLYLVADAVLGTPRLQPSLQIQPIRIPPSLKRPDPGDVSPPIALDAKQFEEIQQYKHYMDSTGQTIRPGLADSIRVLEQMYYEQKNR
jgi:hypothetical protein